jgi:hypothetical protein
MRGGFCLHHKTNTTTPTGKEDAMKTKTNVKAGLSGTGGKGG